MKRKKPALPRLNERAELLSARRKIKMARSVHAYVRGSTSKFYAWLKASDSKSLPRGPAVWICGDCHVGNLGPVADTKGRIDIQIRDLDQTVIGNPALDLVRLGLSLATTARGSDLPGITTAKMLEKMIEGYEQAFGEDAEARDFQKHIPKSIQIVIRRSLNRSWKQLARDRIENIKPTIPLGKRFWPLHINERREIKQLFKREDVRRLATSLRSRDANDPIEVLDAAYWMKGCSSLGHLRFAVLVGIGDPPYKDESLCLMDIKEAVQAVAPRYSRARMPRDNAQRVVEGARHLYPNLGQRMWAARFLDRAVFLRELMPQDLQIEIEHLTRDEATKAAWYLAAVVGQAHARQMNPSMKKKWLEELQRHRSAKLNAPSWLWSSVVELMVSHESEYLDHCRKYALASVAQ